MTRARQETAPTSHTQPSPLFCSTPNTHTHTHRHELSSSRDADVSAVTLLTHRYTQSWTSEISPICASHKDAECVHGYFPVYQTFRLLKGSETCLATPTFSQVIQTVFPSYLKALIRDYFMRFCAILKAPVSDIFIKSTSTGNSSDSTVRNITVCISAQT